MAWQHDFYGETRLFQAIDTDMACADMDEFADNEASALTVRKLTAELEEDEEPVVEILPPEPEILIEPRLSEEPEMIIEPVPEPAIYAMMYGDKDCFGDAWPIYFPTDGSTEVNLDFAALQHDTDIGDNSLSSVAVPEGYELLIW